MFSYFDSIPPVHYHFSTATTESFHTLIVLNGKLQVQQYFAVIIIIIIIIIIVVVILIVVVLVIIIISGNI